MDTLHAQGVYHVTCHDRDGNLKFAEIVTNVVTTQGKNAMLDTYFAGSAYTATLYMSLITAGTPASGWTYATNGTEITSGIITSNTRPTVGWASAASGAKAAISTVFSITGSATVTGMMLVSGGSGANTVGNTAATGGVLFSAATFTSSKTVASGDSLTVSYSITV